MRSCSLVCNKDDQSGRFGYRIDVIASQCCLMESKAILVKMMLSI